ncbi:uncharacterized protein TNCV_493741 [Trichonephila clavipes]|nr:uncharacterized protein TNCV_493741 [Trichonephila clavipes]
MSRAVGSLVVRASDSGPEGLVPCLNWGCGNKWCRHRSSLRGIAPNEYVLSPVWCSRPRPTTGVLLAPCHDEFRGPQSDYVSMLTKYHMIKFIDSCEVWLLPESVARVAAIVGDHRCHTPRY